MIKLEDYLPLCEQLKRGVNMTVKIVNSLLGYFETLYDLNRSLIMCCGLDVIDNSGKYERPLQQIIQDVPRLVPYCCNNKEGKLYIDVKDGLLEYSDELPFLIECYNDILKSNYSFLANVKAIRNKLEHKMHGVKLTSSGSSTMDMFDVTYTIGQKDITLTATQFIKFLKQINELFSRIQKIVATFAYENEKDDHPYYCRLIRYDFCKFNKIYDCDLLMDIGQALFPF